MTCPLCIVALAGDQPDDVGVDFRPLLGALVGAVAGGLAGYYIPKSSKKTWAAVGSVGGSALGFTVARYVLSEVGEAELEAPTTVPQVPRVVSPAQLPRPAAVSLPSLAAGVGVPAVTRGGVSVTPVAQPAQVSVVTATKEGVPVQTITPTPPAGEPIRTFTPTTTAVPTTGEPIRAFTPTTTAVPTTGEPIRTFTPTTTTAGATMKSFTPPGDVTGEPIRVFTPTTTAVPTTGEPIRTFTPTTTTAPVAVVSTLRTVAPTTATAPVAVAPTRSFTDTLSSFFKAVTAPTTSRLAPTVPTTTVSRLPTVSRL